MNQRFFSFFALFLVSVSTICESLAANPVKEAPDTVLKKITILETNNFYYSDRFKSVFLPRSPIDPEIKKLRTYVEEHIPQLPRSEPGIFLALLEFVSMSWEHDQLNESQPTSTSLQVLEMGRAGKTFRCQEYSNVLFDVLTSFGYVSRIIQLRKPDAAYSGLGAGHVALEVYSNLWKKWIFLDPQMCTFVTREDNVPLSFYEMYKSIADSSFFRLLVHASPKALERQKLTNADEYASMYKSFLRPYFGYVGVTTEQSGECVELRLKLEGLSSYLTFQGVPINHRAFTEDADHLYFTLNSSMILFDYERDTNWDDLFKKYDIQTSEDYVNQMAKFAARPDFQLSFRNTVPWFSHYEISIDNGQWKRIKGAAFRWSLRKGENVIRVRSVNAAGVAGPETFARINYGPDLN
jgi:hypothetical protein